MINTDQQHSLLETVRLEVDSFLQTFFSEKIVDARQVDPHYEELWTAISDLSRAGGKRLRPYMTMLAYESFGGSSSASVIPVAASQELLHLSMLVHDDIIDRDLVRYGVKNIQGYYEDRYAALSADAEETSHFAASAALMAGDLLLSSAYEATLQSSLPATDIAKAQKYLSAAIFSVVGGELLDTEAPLRPIHEVDTHRIALYKTASYSFNAPLLTGATLAGADETSLAKLIAFGEALGVAYQLKDDLLGVFGNDELTGKSNTSDISEAKRTYLLQETYRRCSDHEKITLDKLVGKSDLTADEANEVRAIIVRCGAEEATQTVIDEHRDKAHEALKSITIEHRYIQEFEMLIQRATRRSA